jgi:hypothetical protein
VRLQGGCYTVGSVGSSKQQEVHTADNPHMPALRSWVRAGLSQPATGLPLGGFAMAAAVTPTHWALQPSTSAGHLYMQRYLSVSVVDLYLWYRRMLSSLQTQGAFCTYYVPFAGP